MLFLLPMALLAYIALMSPPSLARIVAGKYSEEKLSTAERRWRSIHPNSRGARIRGPD